MNKIKQFFRKIPIIKHIISIDEKLSEMISAIKVLNDISWDIYIEDKLRNDPKYMDSKGLNRSEYQIFSQEAEDGIIAEVFRRIGTTNKYFVEFGISAWECNTIALLLDHWSGLWMDTDERGIKEAYEMYSEIIKQGKLAVMREHITAENIETIFRKNGVPKEPDLLSIDIDGNDYWVWKALKEYKPRLMVIEYNAILGPSIKRVIKYNPSYANTDTCLFGASLKALELLGEEKGYRLVGCDIKGVNAFFVREDLVKDKFLEPFTSECHYEPPRYHHMRKVGYRRVFGKHEIL